jgi:hypothetical protein
LIHDPSEKSDQFFRRFEVAVLSGHYVFGSSGESSGPWFRGGVKLNDENPIRQVLRRRAGFNDFLLPPLFGSLPVQHVPSIVLKPVSLHRRSVKVPWSFR